MANLNWAQCPAAESIPGKRSGAWVFKPFDARLIPCAAVGVFNEQGARFIDGGKVAFRQFNAGFFAEINELLQQVEPGSRTVSDRIGHFLAFFSNSSTSSSTALSSSSRCKSLKRITPRSSNT